MKFLFDLFPVIVFFAAYKLTDIFVATGVAIAATLAQVGWLWLRGRKIEHMLWVSLAIIVLFGGATLLFHDETFIKWKPTVLYWLFAIAFLGAELLFGKNLVRAMVSGQIDLPELVWRRLSLSWVAFFVFMGGLNLYVAYDFPTEVWVNFKLFGTTGLMLLFVFGQAVVLARHIEQ